jgi:hypothetical protein
MINLITRAGWEARAADPRLHPPFVAAPGEQRRPRHERRRERGRRLHAVRRRNEADDRVRGAVAEKFSAAGPKDRKGRSLHELDLDHRLMKYPCSYLIYSPAFDQLPPGAKDPIYRRMWEILSGNERLARYRSALSLEDRRAIVEILRETKPDLPSYFRDVTK